MAKLKPLKPREVVRKLQRLGFEGPIAGGKHQRMVRRETGQIIPIPMHQGRDVGVGLIRAIIQEIGIDRDEWMRL